MARQQSKDGKVTARADGQLRQSQLVTTFGPGAMVDLVDRSVVIGGLEHWSFDANDMLVLDEPRLRRSLGKRLGIELAREKYFRAAPAGDSREPSRSVGVRVLEFPRWFACQSCRRLARGSDGFESKSGGYRHKCNNSAKTSRAIPVRFVAACEHGHLSDFPWNAFVHQDREGERCESASLELIENAIGDVAQILVKCQSCGASRPMSQASVLPFKCSGDRPWLGGAALSEPCDAKLRLLVRTASHAYFGQVMSALRLPEPEVDELRLKLRVKDVWKAVHKITKPEQLSMVAELQEHVASAIRGSSVDEVIEAIRQENEGDSSSAERPLRTAEYERFITAPNELPGTVVTPNTQFAAYRVPPAQADLPTGVERLVVVPELREVRVQVAFSRFDSVMPDLQGQFNFEGKGVRPAALTVPGGKEKWLPAAEVRGEGVFLALDEALVREWEERPAVRARAEQLMRAVESEPNATFYGVRYYMLHSLAHLLLTTISLECGYAASSIRERVYCGRDGDDGEMAMAGLMLYTGTTGAEGTLGGLVEEGRRIRHHLQEAWELGRLCSNDPVCAAHDPSAESSDRNTEGAACHGCLYIAEPSCERFNRHLDRALVVPTIGNDPELAFFRERP